MLSHGRQQPSRRGSCCGVYKYHTGQRLVWPMVCSLFNFFLWGTCRSLWSNLLLCTYTVSVFRMFWHCVILARALCTSCRRGILFDVLPGICRVQYCTSIFHAVYRHRRLLFVLVDELVFPINCFAWLRSSVVQWACSNVRISKHSFCVWGNVNTRITHGTSKAFSQGFCERQLCLYLPPDVCAHNYSWSWNRQS